jgi:hypothetical protein
MRTISTLCLTLALTASPALAGEFSAAVGVFTLAEKGLDLHLSYRPENSHWQYGLRYVRFTEGFDYGGAELTNTTTTKAGATVNYLFRPESRATWYLGVSLLKWTQTERSTRTGTSGKDSTTAPFFGGGYRGSIGNSAYYNLGLFLSPAKLVTRTADSAEESTGADVQLQLGIAF